MSNLLWKNYVKLSHLEDRKTHENLSKQVQVEKLREIDASLMSKKPTKF